LQTALIYQEHLTIEKENKKLKRKHSYKINQSYLLSAFKELSIRLFLMPRIHEALIGFLQIVKCTTEIIRPDRNFKRRHNPRTKFTMNYKRP